MRTMSILLTAMLAGCGGGPTDGQATEREHAADTSGDETPVETVDEPADEPDPVPVAPRSGPGQLRVVNLVRGEETGGTVRVLDSAGTVVAEGASGDTFNVQSGTYAVDGHIADASVLVDTPTHPLDGEATVPAGGTAVARIDFPVARVRFNVQRGGRPLTGWRMTVRRQGLGDNPEVQIEPSEDHIQITPGRYDATLRFSGQQVEVSGLIFQGGATQTVPVNVN